MVEPHHIDFEELELLLRAAITETVRRMRQVLQDKNLYQISICLKTFKHSAIQEISMVFKTEEELKRAAAGRIEHMRQPVHERGHDPYRGATTDELVILLRHHILEASYLQPHQNLLDDVNAILTAYRQHFEQFNVRQLRRLDRRHFLDRQIIATVKKVLKQLDEAHIFIEADKRDQMIINLHKPWVKRAEQNPIVMESAEELNPPAAFATYLDERKHADEIKTRLDLIGPEPIDYGTLEALFDKAMRATLSQVQDDLQDEDIYMYGISFGGDVAIASVGLVVKTEQKLLRDAQKQYEFHQQKAKENPDMDGYRVHDTLEDTAGRLRYHTWFDSGFYNYTYIPAFKEINQILRAYFIDFTRIAFSQALNSKAQTEAFNQHTKDIKINETVRRVVRKLDEDNLFAEPSKRDQIIVNVHEVLDDGSLGIKSAQEFNPPTAVEWYRDGLDRAQSLFRKLHEIRNDYRRQQGQS